MTRSTNHKNQDRFVNAQKEKGLKRLVLWARPEDVEGLKMAARQPHSLAKLRKAVEAEETRKMKPAIRAKIERRLTEKTEKAMVSQKRAQARRSTKGANRPPECIKFHYTPPAARRMALKAAGWLYDPVSAVWHVPDDPSTFTATERLIEGLKEFRPEKLAKI